MLKIKYVAEFHYILHYNKLPIMTVDALACRSKCSQMTNRIEFNLNNIFIEY